MNNLSYLIANGRTSRQVIYQRLIQREGPGVHPPPSFRSDIEILATTGLHIVTQTAGLCLLLFTFFVRVTASEGGEGWVGDHELSPSKFPKLFQYLLIPRLS